MTTKQIVLNHEHATMHDAVVAVIRYVRAMVPHRDDEMLQFFLLVDTGDGVQILRVDAGTWPDFGDGGLHAVSALAHALRATGVVIVERGSRDRPASIDVHLRPKGGPAYRLWSADSAPQALLGAVLKVAEIGFEILPGPGPDDGIARKIWSRLDANDGDHAARR
jgi:hypothetical protein